MTVRINLSRAASRSDIGDSLQITFGQPDIGEDIVETTSTQMTTIAATDTQQIWDIYPPADVWAAFGLAPDASVPGKRRFLPAGIPRNFGVRAKGEKVAIMLAS